MLSAESLVPIHFEKPRDACERWNRTQFALLQAGSGPPIHQEMAQIGRIACVADSPHRLFQENAWLPPHSDRAAPENRGEALSRDARTTADWYFVPENYRSGDEILHTSYRESLTPGCLAMHPNRKRTGRYRIYPDRSGTQAIPAALAAYSRQPAGMRCKPDRVPNA